MDFPFIQFASKHPVSGKKIVSRVETIIIRRGLLAEADQLMAALGIGKRIAIVCDEATYAALGATLEKNLSGCDVKVLMLGGAPKATEDMVFHVREASESCDILIAAGSGTINDITKYASFLASKPFVVFASAASMNGYASGNAAITVRGHKKSLAAHLPRAIFCDLDVIAAAPQRLLNCGLGDSLCRSTSQTDWYMSHLLLGTPYDEAPFKLLAPYESELFERAGELNKGSMEAVELLVKTLILSGLGMVIAGGSYPASQGEHLIAHTMEMVYGRVIPDTFHGEQIAVTTLTMAHMQERMMALSLQLIPRELDEGSIIGLFGQETGLEVLSDFRKKSLGQIKIKRLNEKLEAEWKHIVDKLQEHFVPFGKLQTVMRNARGPITIDQLGWKIEQYSASVKHAHFVRDRFTFLDLAYYRM